MMKSSSLLIYFSLVLGVKLWVDELGKGDLYGQCPLLWCRPDSAGHGFKKNEEKLKKQCVRKRGRQNERLRNGEGDQERQRGREMALKSIRTAMPTKTNNIMKLTSRPVLCQRGDSFLTVFDTFITQAFQHSAPRRCTHTHTHTHTLISWTLLLHTN